MRGLTPTFPATWLFTVATTWDGFLISLFRATPFNRGRAAENSALYTYTLHLRAFGNLCARQHFSGVSSQRSNGLAWGKHIWTFNRHCRNAVQKAAETSTALFPNSAAWLISASTTETLTVGTLHTVSVAHPAAVAVGAHPAGCHCFAHQDQNSSFCVTIFNHRILAFYIVDYFLYYLSI